MYRPLPPGLNYDLISVQQLSAATTATAAIPPGAYREIRIISKTTGGLITGVPVTLTVNGDGGANYDAISFYTQGSAAAATNVSLAGTTGQLALTATVATAPDLDLDIRIWPTVLTGKSRAFFCSFLAHGSAAATMITGTSNGYWNNTSAEISSLRINYSNTAAATGTIEFWGT